MFVATSHGFLAGEKMLGFVGLGMKTYVFLHSEMAPRFPREPSHFPYAESSGEGIVSTFAKLRCGFDPTMFS